MVVCDRSAAWLHGVDAFDPSSLDYPSRLEVVSRAGHEPTRRSDVLGGTRDLLDNEICLVEGIPTTTPLRTAVDLGCMRGRSSAYAALCMLARCHDLSQADLTTLMERFRKRRGVTQLRELVPLVDRRYESPGEAWTVLAMIDSGLPRPDLQVWVTLPDGRRVRLDAAYRYSKVAVEYDGEEFHTEEDREADEARRAALRQCGWTVIVVRRHQLAGPALDAWIAEVREALAAARPQGRSYARAPRPSRR